MAFISWEDTKSIFHYNIHNLGYNHDFKLLWFETAWQALQLNNMLNYQGEIERHLVICRLASVFYLYTNIFNILTDSNDSIDNMELYYGLDLNDFRMGQIFPEKFTDETDQDSLVQESFQLLIDRGLQDLKRALSSYYGNMNMAFAGLYLGIMGLEESEVIEDTDDEYENLIVTEKNYESIHEFMMQLKNQSHFILNEASLQNMQAYNEFINI